MTVAPAGPWTNVEAGPSKGGNKFIDVDRGPRATSIPEITRPATTSATYRCTRWAWARPANPVDERELQMVYEMHSKGMKVLPTYGVDPGRSTPWSSLVQERQASSGA